MTVAEFQRLPRPIGPVDYELRAGQMAPVARPNLGACVRRDHILQTVRRFCGEASLIAIALPFQPLPEYELRVADIGFVNADRIAAADKEDNLKGAPDIVIEILSPSNTHAEIEEKQQICLENGCQEFWVVNMDKRQVKISRPDGTWSLFRVGQQIPLPVLGGASLAVDEIFG